MVSESYLFELKMQLQDTLFEYARLALWVHEHLMGGRWRLIAWVK